MIEKKYSDIKAEKQQVYELKQEKIDELQKICETLQEKSHKRSLYNSGFNDLLMNQSDSFLSDSLRSSEYDSSDSNSNSEYY